MSKLAYLENHSSVLMSLPVRLLNVDDSYQKPLSMAHVKKIVGNFNQRSVAPIHVSKRTDGSFWIFDGQHRAAVYKTLKMKDIDCLVYEGMTLVEEARGYIDYNTIKSQNVLDRAKAELLMGDPSMVAIDAVVTNLGLQIDYQRKNSNNALQSIGAIKVIYSAGGVSDLKTVLNIVSRSLGNHKNNFQGIILQGIHLFITEYRDVYDERWLVKRIKSEGRQVIDEGYWFQECAWLR